MIKFLRKIKVSKKIILSVIALGFISFLIGGFSLAADSAGGTISQGVGTAIATVLSWIAWVFVKLFGLLLTLFIKILVNVAQFNNIIDVDTVIQGWVIVRDLCNMIFILLLLIIAFATILRQENFSAKKLLPKLLIMAVLINFSRMIFGLMIDLSQIVMLTFVNGFAEFGAGNFVNMFQTNKVLSMWTGTADVDSWAIVAAILAGVIALLITNIVVLVMVAILVMRIIMLWIYTIFSPLVFMGFAIPAIQKYTGKIWEDFTKQLIVGPVLAFFLWLALATVNSSANKIGLVSGTAGTTEICAGIGAFFCEGTFQTFIITIGLLMGGLMVAQGMGGAIGSIAGKGMAAIQKGQGLAGKGAFSAYNWGGRQFASFKGFKLGRRDETTGERGRILRGFEIRPDKVFGGMKESLAKKAERQERNIKIQAGAQMKEGRLLGALGASKDFADSAAQGFLWNRAWRPSEKGAIFSTFMAGRANKKIEKLEKEKRKAEADFEKNGSPENMEKVVTIENQIKEQEKVLDKYRAPEPFTAAAAHEEAIREEEKKLGDNDNEDDLVDKFTNAYRQGNKELSSAIFLHAAKVGHSNEMLEMVKVLKDVRNDKGELLSSAAKGDTFTANGAGLKAMVNQYFKKGLGMSNEEAHALQNQFSALAQHVRHYNVAQSIGSRNGILYQRDDATQKKRTVNEMMKTDVEKLWRDTNRLGHGGEITFHGIGPDGEKQDKRIADFDEQSLEILFKTAATALQELNERQRANTNNALNGYNTFKTELEIDGKEELGIAPNEELGKAITSPFMSILKRLKASDSENDTFFDKNGDKATYRELALGFLKYGRTKYEAATFSDLTGKISSEKDEGKKEKLRKTLEREKELGVKIGAWIDKELSLIPSYQEKKSKKSSGSKKKTADELPPD